MRPPQLRTVLPWLIGLSLIASVTCLALTVYLGMAARTRASENEARQLAGQADNLARQIDGDMAQYDLALREAARLLPPQDAGTTPSKQPLLDLPLTAQYIGFINLLNESGDVVADPRSNVSRPVNFAGRDYFQDHQKNPADTVMIGRPFGTAPNQHASIPISRRLNRPDGSFAGVVVAGVHLAWLSDLLSHPTPGPHPTVTIRRDDGLILMRVPYDQDAIGRNGATDPAWQAYQRSGLSPGADDPSGIRLFHRLGTPPLVLELMLDRAEIAAAEPSWLIWLPPLALIPGLCVLGLSFAAHRLLRRGDQIEAGTRTANDERISLVANMSHELRSPLTGILGQAELMTEEAGLNERQTTRLMRLTEAATLMRNIVDRAIDFARPRDHPETPAVTPCDLDPLIRTCLGVVEPEASRKGLLLSSTVDPATPRRIMLARDQVQESLINLLKNAVKYTAQGTVALRIRGNATRLWFEVADTGRGIPRNKRHRLFRAYDRLDSPEPRAGGTGLGLTITEHLVKAMGGCIGHRDSPGGGSVFWIELPISIPAPAPTEVAPAAPPPEMRLSRILLADDLDLTRTVTAELLRSAGHVVTEVSGGEAAIAELQAGDFDLLLTDMRMPVVDGLEVTRRVRALPGHRGRTPVVLLTADLLALHIAETGRAGVDVCVRKPFTRTELLAAVATAARLTPVPDNKASDNVVLDEDALTELRQSLSDEALAAHLGTARGRIADLLTLLERQDAPDNPTLKDAVHDLIGVAGLLGLTPLSLSLRWFDTAEDRGAPGAALHEAATAALSALDRQ